MPKQILLVDNSAASGQLLRILLADPDRDIHVAAYLSEANKLMRVKDFDLLILNILLSNCDGLIFCRQVRERFPNLPIIFFAAMDTPQTREITSEVPWAGIVSQTAGLDALCMVIDKLLYQSDALKMAG